VQTFLHALSLLLPLLNQREQPVLVIGRVESLKDERETRSSDGELGQHDKQNEWMLGAACMWPVELGVMTPESGSLLDLRGGLVDSTMTCIVQQKHLSPVSLQQECLIATAAAGLLDRYMVFQTDWHVGILECDLRVKISWVVQGVMLAHTTSAEEMQTMAGVHTGESEVIGRDGCSSTRPKNCFHCADWS
jgi:hypothetical protein